MLAPGGVLHAYPAGPDVWQPAELYIQIAVDCEFTPGGFADRRRNVGFSLVPVEGRYEDDRSDGNHQKSEPGPENKAVFAAWSGGRQYAPLPAGEKGKTGTTGKINNVGKVSARGGEKVSYRTD